MADNSSGMNAIIAIVAIVAVIFVAYFAVQMLSDDAGNGTQIEVDLPGTNTGGGGAQ